jgi:hypothetical protein
MPWNLLNGSPKSRKPGFNVFLVRLYVVLAAIAAVACLHSVLLAATGTQMPPQIPHGDVAVKSHHVATVGKVGVQRVEGASGSKGDDKDDKKASQKRQDVSQSKADKKGSKKSEDVSKSHADKSKKSPKIEDATTSKADNRTASSKPQSREEKSSEAIKDVSEDQDDEVTIPHRLDDGSKLQMDGSKRFRAEDDVSVPKINRNVQPNADEWKFSDTLEDSHNVQAEEPVYPLDSAPNGTYGDCDDGKECEEGEQQTEQSEKGVDPEYGHLWSQLNSWAYRKTHMRGDVSPLPENRSPFGSEWKNSVAICAIMMGENTTDVREWLLYHRCGVPVHACRFSGTR